MLFHARTCILMLGDNFFARNCAEVKTLQSDSRVNRLEEFQTIIYEEEIQIL